VRAALATVAGVLAVAATGGCADATTAAATAVAQRFYAAVQHEDGSAACRLMAPSTRSELERSAGKRCSAAILQQGVPSVRQAQGSEVFGRMAQVRYAGETAFLTRSDGGWLVLAVSCGGRPAGRDRPYDCQVKGG
jgi:hypothetical protein